MHDIIMYYILVRKSLIWDTNRAEVTWYFVI